MATNYPGPYEVEYEYVVSGLTHKVRFNCVVDGAVPAAGTAPSAINLMTRSGAPRALNTCADEMWGWLRTSFATSVTCAGYTLWRYATPGSGQKTFVTQGSVMTPAGTNGSSLTLSGQHTLSFRSAAGGIMKITLLENGWTSVTRSALIANASGNQEQKIAAYIVSANNWAIARDNGFPIAPTYYTGGQNEAVFKKRNRNF